MLAALAAVCFALVLLLAWTFRLSQMANDRWATERAALIRAVIARSPADLVGLEAAARREPRSPRVRDEYEPPPGTQPVGLDGGSY